MCQATVYLGDEVVARDVTGLDPADGGVRLTTLFEEPTFVAGQIRHIDFLRHRVLLEPCEEVGDE
ncbi:MAG: CooT family nickel-binding protein [Anaerolineales bacterium]|nr:CooT family nickel-binding protein [Anaerolineales bacterium]